MRHGRRFFSARLGGDPGPDLLAEALRGNAWRSFVTEQRALLREMPRIIEGIEAVRAPATVVIGERDKMVPASVADALTERLPNARLVVVPGAGHGLPFEAPIALARVIETVALDPAPDPGRFGPSSERAEEMD